MKFTKYIYLFIYISLTSFESKLDSQVMYKYNTYNIIMCFENENSAININTDAIKFTCLSFDVQYG